MAVGVGPDPEQPQHTANQQAHRADHGRKQFHDHLDRGRHLGRRGFRIGDRIGLGQHLREDQHQQGHHQRGHGHATLAEKARQQGRRQRGRKDVDQVVAQQDRPDQALVILGNQQRTRRPFRSLVRLRAQLAARGRGQRRFAARKEGRHHQQQTNATGRVNPVPTDDVQEPARSDVHPEHGCRSRS
jgi:hypothetical protein